MVTLFSPIREFFRKGDLLLLTLCLAASGFGLVLIGFKTALQSSSATLTVALYVYASERGETDVAFAIAAILMVLTLFLNLAAQLAGRKLKRKE